MKKILCGILAAALCLSLGACGGDKKAADFVPADTAKALMDGGAFSESLTEIDKATACTLYGIDEAAVKDSAVYGSTGATAEEVAVFTFAGSDDAKTALTALETRVSDRKDALKDYQPAEISKLDGAIVEARGGSVLLVVASDYDAARKALGE